VKTKEPAELERERVSALLDLGQQYAKYLVPKDTDDAIRNGRSVDQFRDVIMAKMQSAHTDTSQVRIGMEKKEIQRYSIARAVAASITGNWANAGLERAASQAVEKMLGQSPEGFFVPYDAFQRDFNVGTGTEAGNLVATDLRTDLFVDVLRNNLVLAGLGIRILSGLTSTVDIPKKTVASSIGMVTEIQALTETNPNTGKVTLSPKRMGGYVEYSKQALIQSALAIEPMLRDDLLQGLAVNIQDQVINGSGSGANMRGIRNTSGIGSVVGGTNGLALAWTHIVGLESACANVNAEPDRVSGYLINTKSRGTTKTTQKATNLPFIWDNGDQPLNGYRAAVSNTVPSNLTKGTSTTICSSVMFGSDWSMSVLGLFGAPDVTVDPYSLATTGQVRITLNHFADHGVRIAACFASMEDALTP
jgi:HK97 family phage major capsid protein